MASSGTSESSYVDATSFMTCTNLDRVDAATITPLEFYRTYVAASRPCIIEGAFDHWPANKLWNDDADSIVRKCGPERLVTCNFTPNGYGDHVYKGVVFVKPEERKIEFGDVWDRLKRRTKVEEGIPYLSFQNDCLRQEFPCLKEDVDVRGLLFANEVFGDETDLEAVNLWIGDERSISSVHKDPFENIYCVVRGTKTFVLLPPTDIRFMDEKAYPSAYYKRRADVGNGSHFDVVVEPGVIVPWIDVDPGAPDLAQCPQLIHASPLHVEVSAGETLFLPALWYHRVSSKNGMTIAVNYWYEMKFGPLYTAYQLARELSRLKPEHEYDESDLTDEQRKWLDQHISKE